VRKEWTTIDVSLGGREEGGGVCCVGGLDHHRCKYRREKERGAVWGGTEPPLI